MSTGSRAPLVARNVTRGTVLADRLVVADSFWGRFRGLMGRSSWAVGDGLLLGGNGIHMFFMRFPIDAVFVGREERAGARRVVTVREGLRPWTGIVPLVRGAAAVIELPVGSIRASGTTPGDEILVEESAV